MDTPTARRIVESKQPTDVDRHREAWAHLIRTHEAWGLGPWHAATARGLVEAGEIGPDGEIPGPAKGGAP